MTQPACPTSLLLACTAALTLTLGCSRPDEPLLLADSMAGRTFPILEVDGAPMVWVSSEDGSDPREGGLPDPRICEVSGGGSPRLVKPDHGNSMLGKTTLYAVATIEGLQPPGEIICFGADIKHVYVGTP